MFTETQRYCARRVASRAIQGPRAHARRRHPRTLDKLLHIWQRQTSHRQPVQQRTRKFLCAPLRRRHRGHRDGHGDEPYLGSKDTVAALRVRQGRPGGRVVFPSVIFRRKRLDD